MPTRKWTKVSLAAFEAYRRRYMTEVDDSASGPWESLSDESKAKYLSSLPKKVKADEFKRLTSQAWEIGKRPISKFCAPRNGSLQLAKGMNGRTGYDSVRFRKGDDLNYIVYNHYNARVDPVTFPGVNYVSPHGILAKKREYLGPDPRVAGYRFSRDKCNIEFWEAYLQNAWYRDTDWSVDVEFDAEVQWWFPLDRNMF